MRIHAAAGYADWDTYALVELIEEARRDGRNPARPSDLHDAATWRQLAYLGLQELAKADDDRVIGATRSWRLQKVSPSSAD